MIPYDIEPQVGWRDSVASVVENILFKIIIVVPKEVSACGVN
jgi:hypothetical protein